jgi:hypothetical protein
MKSMRKAALMALCGAAVAAAPARADVVTAPDAAAARDAIAAPGFPAGTAEFTTISAPHAVGIDGKRLVLSTGDATLADDPDVAGRAFPSVDNRGGRVLTPAPRGDTALDVTTLRIPFNGLATQSCLSFDFRFLSEEYSKYVGSKFNDAFIAELDHTTWTTSASAVTGLDNDFARDPDGQPVTIKTTGATSMSAAEAAGTPYGGATTALHAQVLVPAGAEIAHDLYLSIFDQSDRRYDTAAFVENLALTPGTCERAVVPPVAIAGPSTGATVDTDAPTLSGTAGDALGDDAAVTVRIYQGPAATGTPVQTLTAPRTGTSWSVATAALAPGQYTAQATQRNAQGIEGLSTPVTFTVLAPPPTQQTSLEPPQQAPPQQTPPEPPAPGRSLVVGPVSGKVSIKLPRGKRFTSLTALTNIPVGAEVDARNGRVVVTAAADTGGAKTQTAEFYGGLFEVRQSVPKTTSRSPVSITTELSLKSASASGCPRPSHARAVAAAKKKGPKSVLGKLWGNGKGRFRTSGKYSSATVRGTIWLTEDRCDGTLTTVKRGIVDVRDFVRQKTLAVKAGHSYLARAGRPK